MAVVIETTLGDITVDLYLDQRPVTCLNFLKLCKMKYFNYNLFHTIRSGFIAQTGDPTGEGSGGASIFGILEGPTKRFFSGEKRPKIRHTNAGLLSMVCTDEMMVGSQFFFTLAPDLDSLDGVHCVIGEVTEGHDVLRKLNDVICDEGHRPYQDVRITHTVILEDPFNDPPGFRAPSRSPSPSAERLIGGRIAPDEEVDETQGKTAEEIQEMIEEKEAKARATILEIVGDLPDADIAPPENVLFVCKLNPVTTDEDLEIIFSRFGKIVSCEVIRDKKTGDSLQYAFIEFADKKSCEDAYFKMDNVLIDDRRIHVDFSQSVSKMRWLGKGRGVKYFNNDDEKNNHITNKSYRSHSKDREREKNKSHGHEKSDKPNKYNKEYNHGDRERRHRSERELNHKERSRSPSKVKKSRDGKYERNSPKSNNDSHYHKTSSSKCRESGSQYNKSHSKLSPVRHNQSTANPSKNRQDNTKYYDKNNDKYSSKEKHKKEEYDQIIKARSRKNKNDHSGKDEALNDPNKKRSKRKHVEEHSDLHMTNKKKKHDETVKSKTPSPVIKEKKKNNSNKKNMKSKENAKKRRKPSTSSSESDSSDTSSTSSDSSSSSEEERKKKKLKRHRKKYSSSSSSTESSDSSSSSTSSDSSSDSSSSSSDSEQYRKRHKKNVKNKVVKKLKKTY